MYVVRVKVGKVLAISACGVWIQEFRGSESC